MHLYTCCYTLQDPASQLCDGGTSEDAAVAALTAQQSAAAGGSSSSGGGGALYQQQPQPRQTKHYHAVTDDDCAGAVTDDEVYSQVSSSVLSMQQVEMITALAACSNTYSQFCYYGLLSIAAMYTLFLKLIKNLP
jgi:hypothetical protein